MIQTGRLTLRPVLDTDRDAIFALNAHPEVGAWLGGVRTRAESDRFVDRVQALQAKHGFSFWGVERLQDRRLIGMTGLWPAPDGLPEAGKIEIGWRFHPDAWGKGYATEAARAALAYGFEVLRLPEILAWTARSNLASQAVMRRIGMVAAPERDFDHPALADDDPLRPHVVFLTTA